MKRSVLNRAAWTLPPFALVCCAYHWQTFTVAMVCIYLSNLIGYIEGDVTQ